MAENHSDTPSTSSDLDLPADGIPETREKAEELGLKKFRGKTCYNCATDDGGPRTRPIRYVSNGACVECAKRKARERYHRKQRIKKGLEPEPPKKQHEMDFISPITEYEQFILWETFCFALRTHFQLRVGIITRSQFEQARYVPKEDAWQTWKYMNK